MAYEIISNFELPKHSAVRNRSKSEFTQTLEKLEVGEGFAYDSDKALKFQYPKVAPKKFGGRKFQVGLLKTNEGVNTFGVKRIA